MAPNRCWIVFWCVSCVLCAQSVAFFSLLQHACTRCAHCCCRARAKKREKNTELSQSRWISCFDQQQFSWCVQFCVLSECALGIILIDRCSKRKKCEKSFDATNRNVHMRREMLKFVNKKWWSLHFLFITFQIQCLLAFGHYSRGLACVCCRLSDVFVRIPFLFFFNVDELLCAFFFACFHSVRSLAKREHYNL